MTSTHHSPRWLTSQWTTSPQQLGLDALLAKVDIKSAYRLIPVHPQDHLLLAMQWDGKSFINMMLPFGLHSSAKIFNVIADVLSWHLQQTGIPLLFHYLNDFIIVGTPQSVQYVDSLEILDKECSWLSVSMTAHKCESPTTCLPVLGIIIDTIAGELHLPEDKLE